MMGAGFSQLVLAPREPGVEDAPDYGDCKS